MSNKVVIVRYSIRARLSVAGMMEMDAEDYARLSKMLDARGEAEDAAEEIFDLADSMRNGMVDNFECEEFELKPEPTP